MDTKPKSKAAERKAQRLQEQLLAQIAQGARACKEVERELASCPAPELETLIQLHRVLIFKLSLEANASPALAGLVKELMKPVLDWARLEERRRQREWAEQKYSEQVEAEKAAHQRENGDEDLEKALTPELLEKIERKLKLL